MAIKKPYCLSIAGFDPSAGAGVLADIKTFEANGVYGLGVCSALTYQNDIAFNNVDWVPLEKIKKQIAILLCRFEVNYVKIGLIENLEVLQEILLFLKLNNPACKILWDPIIKASAGFEFHASMDKKLLDETCKQLFLITPNLLEAQKLSGKDNLMDSGSCLSAFCKVLIKGGHSNKDDSTDVLFSENSYTEFSEKRINNGNKHGSGCVLSSAIIANLASEKSLKVACKDAKEYISFFLKSNDTLLGYHNYFK